jgi:tRNA dimethylallyltransferase
VHEAASVALYRDAARAAIERIRRRGAVPLLVGGSGLYVEAVLRELDFPATDPELRAELERQAEVLGPDALWRRLAEEDPAAAQRIPSGNLRRVVRALEVVTLTGRPYAASLPDRAAFWRPALRFVVEAANDELAARLDRRARTMWAGGLLDEVRRLLPRGLADGPTASRAIGYAQAIAVLGGRMSIEDGTEETIRLTWRMVRRQRAWFGRDEGAVRLEGEDAVGVVLGALAGAPGSLAR